MASPLDTQCNSQHLSDADKLLELLELYDAGETVSWPRGYDAQLAQKFINFLDKGDIEIDNTSPVKSDHQERPVKASRTLVRMTSEEAISAYLRSPNLNSV